MSHWAVHQKVTRLEISSRKKKRVLEYGQEETISLFLLEVVIFIVSVGTIFPLFLFTYRAIKSHLTTLYCTRSACQCIDVLIVHILLLGDVFVHSRHSEGGHLAR